MAHSGFFVEADHVTGLAVGYTRRPGMGSLHDGPEPVVNQARGISAAGGADSTVGDLLRFSQALRQHRLLNPTYTALEMSGGAGASAETVNGVRIVGHGGGSAGVNTFFYIYPDLGYTVAVLSNEDPTSAMRVYGRLQWELAGGTLPSAIHLGAAALQRFEGEYALPSTAPGMLRRGGRGGMPAIRIAVDGDGLAVDVPEPPVGYARFLPVSPTEFFDQDDPGPGSGSQWTHRDT